MPITVTTPYISVDDADDYFTTRLRSELWFASTPEEKLAALIGATDCIDGLKFKGLPEIDGQLQAFPRFLNITKNGCTVVQGTATTPDAVLKATCEIALTQLEGFDQEIEEQNLGVVTSAYSTVRTTFDSTVRRDFVRAGISSSVAWRLLYPLLGDFRTFRQRRVT